MLLRARDIPCQVPNVGLSGDVPPVDADLDVSGPDTPSIDSKKPKKRMFGSMFKRRPSKAKIEVSVRAHQVAGGVKSVLGSWGSRSGGGLQ